MTEAIVTQKFVAAGIDADTWGEYINADKMIVTRLGQSYPSAPMQARINTQKGLLPANVFSTKAEMVASLLPNDSYAVVTLDPNIEDNGNYQKIAGAWIYIKYNPLLTAVDILNEMDTRNAQSGLSIAHYLEDLRLSPSEPSTITEKLELSQFVGVSDPKLKIGYVDAGYRLINDSVSRSVSFDIPRFATHIANFALKTPAFFALVDSKGQLVFGGSTDSAINVKIPIEADKIVFTVGFADSSKNQDFATNGVIITKSNLKYFGNKVLRNKNVIQVTDKPTANNKSAFLLSSLPSYATAVPITNASFNAIAEIISGFTVSYGVVTQAGTFTAKIPVPDGAKSFDCALSSYQYVIIADSQLRAIKTVTSADKFSVLPDNAKFLLVGLKYYSLEVDLSLDSVTFYYDEQRYVLNDSLGKALIKSEAANNSGKIMLAEVQNMIAGLDFRLYRESLFSGYHPLTNFSIEVVGDAIGVLRDRGNFVSVLEAGQATVSVYDERRNLLDRKTTSIRKKPMPTAIKASFSVSNPLQVLFIGDSLIWNNSNAIGKEWLRMLNTEQPTQAVVDGVVYPPTFNLGKGNIRLVGTKSTADRRYELGNTLGGLMGDGVFYDPSSSQPDTLDLDGWNKRVDIAKYLQSICGVGKYPRYIYLACGVNDIVQLGWDINSLPIVANKMRSVLGRLKQACDTIAGGNSNVQILLMNHQFYPLNQGTYHDYSNARQRLVWTEHYKNYEKMINEESINGKRLNTYVRFVDCASSFDVEHGYSYETATVNPRNTQTTNLVVDPVHMGDAGACMYADALLRDFLYHECS